MAVASVRRTRLGQPPGHSGRRPDDEEDRSGQEAVSTSIGMSSSSRTAIDEQSDEDGIDDTDRGHLGRRGDALDDGGADHEWQGDGRQAIRRVRPISGSSRA